ncbi:sugar porter family MFS transporter [Microbacterium excoecariae]|uniref:sugar porter family MFS transporter n=1 Tax=Microbacterium excoecariae TaxID=2715210 RepID=UPI00140A3FDE|nr:sugar porter family MFS transporter [Microbacterium excoecariae]NHI16281.1 sugar porter family MFS transporter [Microbacterium excoecariae]
MATASSDPHTLPPLTKGPHSSRLGLISIVACLGGLLFGYDTGVINGALPSLAEEMGLTALSEGVVTSSLVFAAAIGAIAGGRISDAIGRRRTILILAVLFFVGSVVVVTTPNVELLVFGRILLGLGVGGASAVVPVFLAELAPFEIRGSITGRNELAIVSGQLAAFVINAIIGNVWGHIDGVWRLMFAVCALPAIALFFGMLRMPESPRWLIEKGRNAEALAVLKTVRSEERAEAEIAEIEQTARAERAGAVGLRAVFQNKWLVRILLVGVGLGIAQQLTGINSVMYYGNVILTESGFEQNAALIANIAPGVIAVVGGVIALYLMDRVDRRKTIITGFTLTTISHVLIGVASMVLPEDSAARPFVILALVVIFVGSMQTFLNIAVWVYIAEVFPLHMRGVGTGVSIFMLWITNGFLSLYFPSMVEGMGITGTFFLFAGVGVVALIFVITQLPETRGRTLEQLEEGVTTGTIFTMSKRDQVFHQARR